ncbi:MAG: hypothetical protein JO142_09135 [Burkholderiales bacterium]|nr:hypothetical protein [Burkholderiales bacterium]
MPGAAIIATLLYFIVFFALLLAPPILVLISKRVSGFKKFLWVVAVIVPIIFSFLDCARSLNGLIFLGVPWLVYLSMLLTVAGSASSTKERSSFWMTRIAWLLMLALSAYSLVSSIDTRTSARIVIGDECFDIPERFWQNRMPRERDFPNGIDFVWEMDSLVPPACIDSSCFSNPKRMNVEISNKSRTSYVDVNGWDVINGRDGASIMCNKISSVEVPHCSVTERLLGNKIMVNVSFKRTDLKLFLANEDRLNEQIYRFHQSGTCK